MTPAYGVSSWWGSNLGFLHWLASSTLQHYRTTVRVCEWFFVLISTYNTNVTVAKSWHVRIPSGSRHVRHDVVAMTTAVVWQQRIEHSAVMGVWRANAWTNLMKFGTHQQIKTLMTVVWSNFKIFKIQVSNFKLKNIGNAITRLPMARLGRNLGIRMQWTPLPQNCFVSIGRYC